jgi:hypothetical protein
MANEINKSKLDQVVKDSLVNYEVTFDASDWDKMKPLIEANPVANNFKWSYIIYVLGGLLVVVTTFFLYQSFSSSKSSENKIELLVKQSPKQIVKPIITKLVVTPVNKTTVAGTLKEKEITTSKSSVDSIGKEIVKPEEQTAVEVVKEVAPKDKKRGEKGVVEKSKSKVTDKTKKEEKTKKTDKTQKVLKMANEPKFGDTLDSSKGIEGKTKEKEKTKKAAVSQPRNTIGWGSFISKTNLDSFKKYQDKKMNDSLKK